MLQLDDDLIEDCTDTAPPCCDMLQLHGDLIENCTDTAPPCCDKLLSLRLQTFTQTRGHARYIEMIHAQRATNKHKLEGEH